MLHPSYSDLMKVVNSEVEPGEAPVVNSRYSIVMATSKRARQIIGGAEPLVHAAGKKPLSVAVDELNQAKIRILSEEEAEEQRLQLAEWEAMKEEALKEEARQEEPKKEQSMLAKIQVGEDELAGIELSKHMLAAIGDELAKREMLKEELAEKDTADEAIAAEDTGEKTAEKTLKPEAEED